MRLKASFRGERGIRTPGGMTLNSFQDCRNRPLCHLSQLRVQIYNFFSPMQLFLFKILNFILKSPFYARIEGVRA